MCAIVNKSHESISFTFISSRKFILRTKYLNIGFVLKIKRMRYDSNINWLRIVTTGLSINRQQHINIINIFGKRRFYHVSIMDITLNRYLRIKNYDIDNVQLLFKYNFRYAYLLFKITIKLCFKGTRKILCRQPITNSVV